MKKNLLAIFKFTGILGLTLAGTLAAVITSSCSKKTGITTEFVTGSDMLYYKNDTAQFHNEHSCSFKVKTNTKHDIHVTWNDYDQIEDYVTITGATLNQKVSNGTVITVSFDKANFPDEATTNKSVMFVLTDGDKSIVLEITLVNDVITPIPYSLLSWSPADNASETGFWTLDGLEEGVGPDDLVHYDTLLIPADIVSVTNNAFINLATGYSTLPPNIGNLLFTTTKHECFYEIGSCAFENSSLQNVQLPKTISRIGQDAFSLINEFGLSSTDPAHDKVIANPWANNSSYKNIHFWLGDADGNNPNNGDHYNLVNKLDAGNNIIGQAIYPKGGLVDQVNSLSNSVQGLVWGIIDIEIGSDKALATSTIPKNAFANCKSLNTFDVKSQVTKICDRAFANTGSWEETLFLSTDLPSYYLGLPGYRAIFSFATPPIFGDDIMNHVTWNRTGETNPTAVHVTAPTTQPESQLWEDKAIDPFGNIIIPLVFDNVA